MYRPALVALTLVLVSAPAASYADTFTASFTTGPFSYTGREPVQSTPISVEGFNPALGTLNSISASVSGSYTTTILPDHDSDFNVNLESGPNNGEGILSTLQFEFLSGTYTIAGQTQNDTDPYLKNLFTSAGTVQFYFNYYDALAGSDSNATPNGLSGLVTYNYTPAAPIAVTPEPSSLALLGTGILGVAGVLRKRLA